jgi:hypothetical protein
MSRLTATTITLCAFILADLASDLYATDEHVRNGWDFSLTMILMLWVVVMVSTPLGKRDEK